MNRNDVFDYVKNKYGTVEEYPWVKYPKYAVLRHTDNTKWYGIIMNVPGDKLGLDSDKTVDILDVKCDPNLIQMLQKSPGFFPAYHMSKEHWISILLDDKVSQENIENLIDKSYEMTK